MSTLYEIDKSIEELVNSETGEITDFEAFEKLAADRDKKIENTALYTKNLKALNADIKSEINAFKERAEQNEKIISRCENLLNYALSGQKFTTHRVAITYRASTKCVIEDENTFIEAHPEFTKEEVKVKISLADVKTAIKNGEEVSGAHIEEYSNIQIK